MKSNVLIGLISLSGLVLSASAASGLDSPQWLSVPDAPVADENAKKRFRAKDEPSDRLASAPLGFRQKVVADESWLKVVQKYEKGVLLKRS